MTSTSRLNELLARYPQASCDPQMEREARLLSREERFDRNATYIHHEIRMLVLLQDKTLHTLRYWTLWAFTHLV